MGCLPLCGLGVSARDQAFEDNALRRCYERETLVLHSPSGYDEAFDS